MYYPISPADRDEALGIIDDLYLQVGYLTAALQDVLAYPGGLGGAQDLAAAALAAHGDVDAGSLARHTRSVPKPN